MSWSNFHRHAAFSLRGGRRYGPDPVFSSPLRTVLVPSHAVFRKLVEHRKTLTSAVPAVLMPPLVFVGLVITLWTYKCVMMVVFQNKIIYMPYIPLGARKEKIAEYARACRPVQWREERIRTSDGKQIALCVARVKVGLTSVIGRRRSRVVILYFQGNASSLPPRLPFLSQVLQDISRSQSSTEIVYTLVALSYRGYWTSQGRPSQRGIDKDVAAALCWVQKKLFDDDSDISVILWGQSIGAGVASTAAAKRLMLEQSQSLEHNYQLPIRGLILETPFTSIRDMLVALYPQKWLPYRYLGPFLRNWWDSRAALKSIASSLSSSDTRGTSRRLKILVLQAGNDELVPESHGDELAVLGKDLDFDVSKIVIPNALHTEVITKQEGRRALSQFLTSFR